VDVPPALPFLFAASIWVPVFAVVLFFMLRLFGGGGRALPTPDEDGAPLEPER